MAGAVAAHASRPSRASTTASSGAFNSVGVRAAVLVEPVRGSDLRWVREHTPCTPRSPLTS